jgi:hypothetical protein
LSFLEFFCFVLILFKLNRAFWGFHSYFPTQADHLMSSLDAKTQKLLQQGSQGGPFGSVKSLNNGYDYVDSNRYRQPPPSSSQVTPSSRLKRSTSAVDVKNRNNSVISKV